MEAKLYVVLDISFLYPPLLTINRKSLKVADLKEICTRANVPTTTRSTKADLITKILASQPAIDAYNAKYLHNGNPVSSSKPAALSTHNDSVSGSASS
jgi:SAP domain-containing ribonucleoprotein